jgi:hypothetical protein
MKITKRQLKQFIKEEIESTIGEMAFSMDDLEAAQGEVAASDTVAKSEANREEFTKLLSYFVNALNMAGGAAIVKKGYISARDIYQGAIDPYNSNLAVIYKVLSRVSEKMLEEGPNMVLEPLVWTPMATKNAWTNRGDGAAQFKNKADELLSVIDRIVSFAHKTGNVNAPNHDEPYLSVENSDQLRGMMDDVRRTPPYGSHPPG